MLGVTQFNIYLMSGDEEETLDVYGREILPEFTNGDDGGAAQGGQTRGERQTLNRRVEPDKGRRRCAR